MIKNTVKLFAVSFLIIALSVNLLFNRGNKNFLNNSSSSQQQNATSSTFTPGPVDNSNTPGHYYIVDVDGSSYLVETPSDPVTESSVQSSSSNVTTSETLGAITAEEEKIYKKAVSVVFDSIKKGEFDKAKSNLTGDYPYDKPLYFDTPTMSKVKKIFGKLSYEITSVERISKTRIDVCAKVKALDFKKIFETYLEKSKNIINLNPELTSKQQDEKINSTFDEILKNNSANLIETELTLTLIGFGKNWKVEHTGDFSKACLGGILYISDINGIS